MKRLVDLLRVNESRFTAIILGAMTIAAVINFNGHLGSGGGVPCLYDVYIIGILHVVDTFGVPLLLFYTLFVERHNQRIMQVVRERTVNDVWKRCVTWMASIIVYCILECIAGCLSLLPQAVMIVPYLDWLFVHSFC